MNNFDTFKDLISKSSVPFGEQVDLLELFGKASDADLTSVVELCTKDPTWIERINKNYKDKKEAVENQDTQLWRKIIEEEKKELEEIQKYNS